MPKASVDHAKKSIFKTSTEPKGLNVKGYDFSKPFNLQKFLDSYGTTGFQGTKLKQAIDIAKQMRKEDVTIFLGFTSNMISSGVREAILHLVKNKMVHVIVTTAGGIEEDLIKCLKPFIIGEFRGGKDLRDKGINRIGNILVPNDRYIEFEKYVTPVLNNLLEKQNKTGKVIAASEFIRALAEKTADESSVLYWAFKNSIPVICPAITDGSMGDMLFFFKSEHPEFKIDVTDDLLLMNNIVLDAKETGAIILGGSVPKHHIMNANMMREGTKYSIYINTASEVDGSDSGAPPEEAESWGKNSGRGAAVKVKGDATIIFPLLVLGAFAED
ncbi:MAG: deoxyhypusine synthase [Candidatus Aenigmarchaeota archaeon]|nr:deoxyhypusine synthase [Candidatus Aenigmarchaeota archaeon]